MPFTPFHMGPALPINAACGNRFSLLLYGYTQILMEWKRSTGLQFKIGNYTVSRTRFSVQAV
ncbi:hypothetical protein Pla110_39010 [Polystyrenella longa]|uniref:Uncharacterized protein n=1 Tax=Polystyrenella longa TaxID=2528007 RepID=A0A518CSF7_9PLAN|nr:hypothetical protein Pla110_39010 [Polystyrenella longa]